MTNRNLLRASLFVSILLAAFASAQEVPQNIKDALKKADDAIAKIVAIPDGERTFDNTVGAFDDLSAQLDTDTNLFLFMQNVSPDANVRAQARAAEELVGNWAIEVGQREDLYKAMKAYADTHPVLEGEQKRLLEFTMRDYHLAGMDLPKDQRDKLADIEKQTNKLEIDFEQNIADDETVVPLTADELKGVPKDILDHQIHSNGIILLHPDESTYGRVMDHCLNPVTRHKVWLAFRRRGGMKNVHVLEQLIKLRDDAAHLLGFKNSVDMVLVTRMAKNSENVAKFYAELEPLVRKKAEQDKIEFDKAKQAFTHDPKATIDPWDYGFYYDQLLKKKYAVDEEKVAEYFPAQRVIQGFFDITSRLYGIEYKDVTADAAKLGLPIWHPDVKLWAVSDKKTGQLLGRIYTDLYPRPGKYTHAACWSLEERKVWPDGTVQVPLAALVTNLTKPVGDKPALLQHDDVITFFHEFGHGLHNLLTQTKYARFSGTSVERDFVEAPSQMMENWVWEPQVLNLFARHYKTGKPIPASLLAGMRAARTLGSGIDTEGQLYLGEMDQAYHTAPGGKVDTTKVAQEIYAKTTIYKSQPGNLFQAAFGHLVGYNGAYYGYLWSLVYAQDMFQRFKQLGLLSPSTGAYYRSKVLAKGGSEDAMDMLKDYLGRAPKTDAFYEHLGLKKK
ncbi:MAG TPA: M3 family metallopeptidase [Fimbriimonadaceae bacterium]|nr:M3 family metallopeptidase [Fimbriimonadaceae bacterium]